MSRNTVLMPVVAISQKCYNCPELRIGVSQTQLYGMEETVYSNVLYCEHYEKCKKILSATLAKDDGYSKTSTDM